MMVLVEAIFFFLSGFPFVSFNKFKQDFATLDFNMGIILLSSFEEGISEKSILRCERDSKVIGEDVKEAEDILEEFNIGVDMEVDVDLGVVIEVDVDVNVDIDVEVGMDVDFGVDNDNDSLVLELELVDMLKVLLLIVLLLIFVFLLVLLVLVLILSLILLLTIEGIIEVSVSITGK